MDINRMFSSVQLPSHVQLFVTPWTAACQASQSIHHQLPELAQTHGPSSWWCHPTISSSVIPFSSHLRSFPASGSFLMSQFFVSGGQVLELQLQHQSFQWIFKTDFLSDWLVGSPCSPRDSQKSSPTAQFKTINSLALSFLYGLNSTNVWTMWQNKVLIFLYTLENFWDPTLIKKKKMPFCLSSTYMFFGVLVGSEWYNRVYRRSNFDAKVQD